MEDKSKISQIAKRIDEAPFGSAFVTSDFTDLAEYETVKKTIALGILPLAIRRHAAIEPSMLQDLKKHKPCEIGAINGAVCRWGRKYGVPTPVNDRIVEVIRDMESGKSQPGMEQLKRFSDLAL